MTKINLFCLPFAGGSKYSYSEFVKNAPGHLNIIPIELPGRGARFKDNLLVKADDIVKDVYEQIKNKLDQPYAIYGHSMGSLLGYLLVKQILSTGLNKPLHLFFSGRGGPSVKPNTPPRYSLPRAEFFEKIKELGGSTDEVLADNNLKEFFEPILRADFEAVETFEYNETLPFEIPISVMIGISEKTTYEEALAWQKETTKTVTVRQFPGTHFFIFNYVNDIINIITNTLSKNGN